MTLNLMPMQATRHQANKTRFNRASKIVSWSLELIFHSTAASLIKLNTKKNLFSSKDTLRATLTKFYEKYKAELFDVAVQRSNKASNVALYTEFNRDFETGNFDDFNVLFQVIDHDKRSKHFVRLDLDAKLGEALRDRTVLEYPTLYIVRNANLGEYRMGVEEKENGEVREEEKKKLAVKEKTGDLEDGECDSEGSEEFQASDEEVNEPVGKRVVEEDVSGSGSKRIKVGGESEEEGELDDSN